MLYFLLFAALIASCVFAFFNMPMFGKLPAGERLMRIQQSPNYKNGKFSNLSHTPDLTEGATYFSVLKDFLFSRTAHLRPATEIPSVKTNLHNLPAHDDVLVWFGHSSYFMQLSGKTVLVDPVLSGSASPLPGGTKAFNGADIYSADDMPEIDFLFITHDHWDHLDYDT
ncbi:MAG: MBL fold metallo-hydrolase, partial [Chitinophagaceae bacterium]